MSKREEAREKLMRRAAKEISNEETLKNALSFIVEEFDKKKDGKPIPARDIVKAYEKQFHEAAAPTTDDIIKDFLEKEKKRKNANEQAKTRREAKKAPTEEAQTNE